MVPCFILARSLKQFTYAKNQELWTLSDVTGPVL
jgi:hypothetical protein